MQREIELIFLAHQILLHYCLQVFNKVQVGKIAWPVIRKIHIKVFKPQSTDLALWQGAPSCIYTIATQPKCGAYYRTTIPYNYISSYFSLREKHYEFTNTFNSKIFLNHELVVKMQMHKMFSGCNIIEQNFAFQWDGDKKKFKLCRYYLKSKKDNVIFENYDLGLFILKIFCQLNFLKMILIVKFKIKCLKISERAFTKKKKKNLLCSNSSSWWFWQENKV